jgi:hypothetical protein
MPSSAPPAGARASACPWSCRSGATSAGRWTSPATRGGPDGAFAACASSTTPPAKAATPGRLRDRWRAGRMRAPRVRLPPRPAGGDRHGQRSGVHRPRTLRLVGTNRGAAALHPARQADPNAFLESFIGRFRHECLKPALVGLLRRDCADHRGFGASTTTVSAHTAHSATRCRSERPLEEGDGAGLALVREDLV